MSLDWLNKLENKKEEFDLGKRDDDYEDLENVPYTQPLQISNEKKPKQNRQSIKSKKKEEKKDLLKKYILAVNHGHKKYENYGFEDNHSFLLAIFKIIDEL